jgi:Ca2+-binding RTX toxin-like protein
MQHFHIFGRQFGRQAHLQLFRTLKKCLLIGAVVACLLPQTLLAALTSTVAGGVLTVVSTADEDIAVSCAGGNVQVNGADPDSGASTCISITGIVVTGGLGENIIDLSLVDTPEFTSSMTVTVDAGPANDVITGTFFADTLNGGEGNDRVIGHRGADTMNGDGGDDTTVWNPGDGSDIASGGAGDDTMEVNGGGNEQFVISSTVTGVLFQRIDPNPFFVDIISPTERLLLNAGGGDDIVTGTVGLNGVITITVNGGNGDDHITGGDGPDTLNGDGGNDTLIGFRGNDAMNGGADDDTMVWNPGDGSDVANGEDGSDTVEVNGGNGGESFTISGTVTGALFQRIDPNPFFVDIISPTENLVLNAAGGNDIVTGTQELDGVIAITVNGGDGDDQITGGDGDDILNGEGGNDTLTGFRGDDTMNGGADSDTMIWNPGDGSDIASGESGNDTVVVNGGGAAETFTISRTLTGVLFDRVTPNPFFVDIISPTENLLLNAGGGGDIVTGTTGLNGVITITVNGGDGPDLIRGGDGPDTLNGDGDDDTLIGFRGPDTMNGGPGNDTMIWNNGDGSDIMDGGDGDDTAVVNGSPLSETFEISPVVSLIAAGVDAPAVGSVFFRRVNPGPFSLDIEAESVEVNGNDGDDTFDVTPLDNTDITYDGGSQPIADVLRVHAQGAVVRAVLNQILVEDKAPITNEDVEVVEVIDEAFPVKIYMPWLREWRPRSPSR